MTKLAIAPSMSANLAAARRAGEKRKHLWSAIRREFGIPTSIKLAVDSTRQLYVKGTSPRQFLQDDGRGRYSHAAPDQMVATAASLASSVIAKAAGPVGNGNGSVAGSRFSVNAPRANGNGWRVMDRDTLAELLDDNAEDLEDALPEGFPHDAPAGSIVTCNETGRVFYRA